MNRNIAPALYRINHACEYLQVSRATLYRFVRAGDLQLVKLGRGFRGASGITAASIAAFLARSADNTL